MNYSIENLRVCLQHTYESHDGSFKGLKPERWAEKHSSGFPLETILAEMAKIEAKAALEAKSLLDSDEVDEAA